MVAVALRQVVRGDRLLGKQYREPLEQIRQFAHVARPRIARQAVHGLLVQFDVPARHLFLALHEMLDQHRQIFEPLAQRRHLHREHVQPIEQVLTESARADGGVKIAMSRGDDPHVAAHRPVAAHAFEGAFLEHAQELHLHLQRHIADFVEEQGAPFGELETPLPGRECARESAFLVPEQFAFQQVRGNGAAIHRHERVAGTAGQLVDVARHHFLARAGLAEDQHVGVVRRDLLDQPMHRTHGAGRAAWTEAMRARLRGMTFTDVVCLIENGGQTALFHRVVQMKPHEIAAGLRDFRQPVGAQVNHRERQRHRAQFRNEFPALLRHGLFPDDDRQPIVRFGLLVLPEFRNVVDMHGLQVQKSEQCLQSSRLRI